MVLGNVLKLPEFSPSRTDLTSSGELLSERTARGWESSPASEVVMLQSYKDTADVDQRQNSLQMNVNKFGVIIEPAEVSQAQNATVLAAE